MSRLEDTKLPSIFIDLERNVAVTMTDSPEMSLRSATIQTLMTGRYQATLLFRISSRLGARFGKLAGLIKQLNQILTGADISWHAKIGKGLVLSHPNGVVIGPYCRIGDDCIIQQGVTLGGTGIPGQGESSSPTIGDRVLFGAGCKVLGSISVNDDCTLGANAVVITDVPASSIAVGVPARPRPKLAPGERQ